MVKPIEQIRTDGNEAGGKALGLKKMMDLGLRVPPGFVCLQDGSGDFIPELSHAYNDLGAGQVAVRSSAAAEDGRHSSAAGQFESFLFVQGIDDVQASIQKCFSSAESHRVREYYKNTGGGAAENGMAVIVQQMISPVKAGVLFSADPVTGDRNMIHIEAVKGTGDKLVGGFEAGERYIISRTGGPGETPTGKILSGQNNVVLSAEEIRELTAGALLAESAWGYPVDMEWAIDSDGLIHWLQARPVTAAAADSLDTPINSTDLITRCNIGEMLPGAATPLTLSVFAEPLDWGLQEMSKRQGVLRGMKTAPRYIQHIENHLFMNLTSMYYMARNVAGASREAIELNILGRVLPHHDIGPDASGFIRLINGIRYGFYIFSHNRFLKKITRIGHSFRIFTENKTIQELYSDLSMLQEQVLNKTYLYHYLVSAYSGAMNGILAAILAGGKNVGMDTHAKMGMLLQNIPGIESAALLTDMQAIAEAIVSVEKAHWFRNTAVPEGLAWLEGPDAGAAGEKFRAFLHRHGHRCIREAELRSKDYETYPGELVPLIKEILRQTSGPGGLDNNGRAEGSAGQEINAPKWVLKKAKEGVRQREYSKSMLILTQHQFKKGYRKLASMLLDAGLIPDTDLLYFFRREEIGELIEKNDTGTLIRKAEARRRELPYQMEINFPEVSRGKPEPAEPPAETRRLGDIINGTPVCTGIVEGKIRVVTKPEDAHILERGEIMVAPFTDIGWTPFFSSISGLVTEIGGALSHGAVVAREYGVPMVSNIPGITSTLQTGMKVRLDGKAGTLTIL